MSKKYTLAKVTFWNYRGYAFYKRAGSYVMYDYAGDICLSCKTIKQMCAEIDGFEQRAQPTAEQQTKGEQS